MKATWLLMMVLLGVQAEDQPLNLVTNGDFEKGKIGEGPLGWQRPDGLCSFWEKDPLRGGMVMKFDTNVLVTEYRARRDQMKIKKPPPARAKTSPGKRIYDTVAGHDGVAFLSDPMAVEKGKKYRLRVDCRIEPGKKKMVPKVFVEGFFQHKGRERRGYMIYKDLAAGKEWKTFELTFDPTRRSPLVTHVRVKLFPYWPPGTYYFDRVIIEPLPVPKKVEAEGD